MHNKLSILLNHTRCFEHSTLNSTKGSVNKPRYRFSENGRRLIRVEYKHQINFVIEIKPLRNNQFFENKLTQILQVKL